MKQNLVQQFGTYFTEFGWLVGDLIAISVGQYLPKPSSLMLESGTVSMINSAICLLLQNIDTYATAVRKCKLYLSKSITFDKLECYHFSNCYVHQRRHDVAALGPRQTSLGGPN